MKNLNKEELIAHIFACTSHSEEWEGTWMLLDQECRGLLDIIISNKNFCFWSDADRDAYKQDVIEKLYEGLASFDARKGSFQRWFNVVAENTYYNLRESENTRREHNIPLYETVDGEEVNNLDLYYQDKSAEEAFLQKEGKESLAQAIGHLSKEQAEAIFLRDVWGYSCMEAAQMAHCKPADISNRRRRGIKTLQERMERER